VLPHLLEREDAGPCAVEHRLVDVGRIDARPLVDALLLQQDRERVDLLARGASGDPDARERVRPQQRHDLLSKGEVEGRGAEHRRDVDREVEQEPLHARGVVEELVLERRDGREALGVHAAPDASPERRRCVLAEVEAVPAEDAFEQERELDLVDAVALGRVLLDLESHLSYLYSQTRISDSSWSVSTGFAM